MSALTLAIQAGLKKVADPAQAPAMFAYMKGIQPFLGVRTPARDRVVKALLKLHPDQAERLRAVRELWAGAFCEERYAAQDVLAAMRPGVGDLPEMVAMLPGSDHWDLLDSQIGLTGRVLIPHAELRREYVLNWRVSAHLWTRRAATLSQLYARTQTDTGLLQGTTSTLKHEREFFIQKAIGWALREYARTDDTSAAWVRSTTDELGLTGLARREALKHLGPGK